MTQLYDIHRADMGLNSKGKSIVVLVFYQTNGIRSDLDPCILSVLLTPSDYWRLTPPSVGTSQCVTSTTCLTRFWLLQYFRPTVETQLQCLRTYTGLHKRVIFNTLIVGPNGNQTMAVAQLSEHLPTVDSNSSSIRYNTLGKCAAAGNFLYCINILEHITG
jgi:hypothetical protein